MGRMPCCSKVGLNRGTWTAMEDKTLIHYIQIHGEGKWRSLPNKAGLKRCGKSCRLRWLNYLRPGIIRGNISDDEEELIIRLHKLLGNRWSLIAGRLPGRTDNEIKNYWNTKIGKKLQRKNSTSFMPTRPLNSNETQIKCTLPFEPSFNQKLCKQNNETLVIRTKATKCTKVVISASNKSKQYNNIIEDKNLGLKSTSQDDNKNKFSVDFEKDFEWDEHFLFDFFNNLEYSKVPGFDQNIGGNNENSANILFSDDTLFFCDNTCNESNFASISSVTESKTNWF